MSTKHKDPLWPFDVKLFESQRLTDEDDGGGRATGSEVIDGNVNNLFQDIPRIDRTIGDEKPGSDLSLCITYIVH
ncbi:hypothetical protein [Endozoicomonas sp.]|uniref:hypothetical protein n=1 Tax=Endozoicomonas sp. TaxID=1892382 RepID=UPI00288777E3|nr:hypothetical protein [Endozoicomonas sp.]